MYYRPSTICIDNFLFFVALHTTIELGKHDPQIIHMPGMMHIWYIYIWYTCLALLTKKNSGWSLHLINPF